VKTWLKSGPGSLPLSPECTADISISVVEHILSSKSSYLVGVLIDALNKSSLPDFLLSCGMFSFARPELHIVRPCLSRSA